MPSPKIIVREFDFSHYLRSLVDFPIGIVGIATKGPINDKTLVTTQDQLIESFGEPYDPGNPDQAYHEVFAAYQYLKEGRQCWFVRVAGNDKAKADADHDNRVSGTAFTATAREYGSWFNKVDIEVSSSSTTQVTGEAFGSGDGSTLTFNGTLINTPIKAGTVIMELSSPSTVSALDNGAGVISGTGITGTIDYDTGDVTLTFTTPPSGSEDILFSYKYESAFKLVAKNGITGRILSQYTGLTLANLEATVGTEASPVDDYIVVSAGSGYPKYQKTDMSGGADGLTAPDFVGEFTGFGSTGLQKFRSDVDTDIFAIAVPGNTDEEVIVSLIDIASDRKDCIATLDSPQSLTPSEAVDFHNGEGDFVTRGTVQSSYATMEYGWLRVYNPFKDDFQYVPPSAGRLYALAKTVADYELWYAVAGAIRGRLSWAANVEYGASEGERDYMYDTDTNSLNPVIDYPGYGIMLFGQKTLSRTNSALNRLNVRMLLIHIRRGLKSLAPALLFEPNDRILWNTFVGTVEPFLRGIQTRRGLYDFRVIADETTTTADDIDNGIMRAKVLVKPTRAAEVIIIDINVLRTGANFDEYIGTNADFG